MAIMDKFEIRIPYYWTLCPSWFKNYVEWCKTHRVQSYMSNDENVRKNLEVDGIILENDYTKWITILYFNSEDDYSMFLLKWS